MKRQSNENVNTVYSGYKIIKFSKNSKLALKAVAQALKPHEMENAKRLAVAVSLFA